MQRAAISVPSNIAEGAARRSTKEFLLFLHIARGSLAELETQVLLARELVFLTDQDELEIDRLIDEVGRLVNAFIQGLRRRQTAVLTIR